MKQEHKLLINYLDIWTAANINKKKNQRGKKHNNENKIYGVQKLRNLILDLALRGNLSTQIKSEKVEIELPQSKKNTKNLNFKKIIESKPHVIPDNWIWTTLENTGTIFNGDSINSDLKIEKYTGLKSGRPFIATKDVGYGRQELNYDNGILIPFHIKNYKIAHKGSVLICSEGGSAGKKIGLTNIDISFGNKLFANETYKGIDPKFIFYVYQSQYFFQTFKSFMSGIIGGISRNKFVNINIPVPPFSEQKRIINKIDELMSICDELEHKHLHIDSKQNELVNFFLNTLNDSSDVTEFENNWKIISENFEILFINNNNINRLRQTLIELAIMGKLVPQKDSEKSALELLKQIESEKKKLSYKKKTKTINTIEFKKKMKLPKNWVLASIQDIVLFITDGTHHTPNYIEKGIPFLSIKDIDGKKISFEKCKYISQEEHEQINKRCNPEDGDILICRIGTLGRVTIIDTKKPFSIFVSLGLLKLPKTVQIKDYLHVVLSSPFLKFQFNEIKVGGIHTDKLNLGDIPKLSIPLPPLEEQKRIINKLNSLLAICDKLEVVLNKNNEKKIQISNTLTSIIF